MLQFTLCCPRSRIKAVHALLAKMVSTTIQYLAREKLYESEKPYSAEFEIEEQDCTKKTNYILSTQPVTVYEIQLPNRFNLDVHGFCTLKSGTKLRVQDALTQPEAVESAYMDEIKAILHKHFPEYRRLEGMEFVVRKRDERFPSDDLAVVTHEQPACLAHSDYSVDGALLQLRASFPGQEEYFQDEEYDIINVWRPLVGPNDDWPLALCDFTSIDPEHDLAAADLLHVNRVAENQLLYHNNQHRWYYVQAQEPDDLIVFRNVDSTGKRARAFHCSFFNPNSQGPPRQSCEVRFVAFR